jgi:undecaprenyl diphosphate synthase
VIQFYSTLLHVFKIPKSVHLALIMDGNGRWALKRGMSRTWGHQKGANALVNIIKCCPDLGIDTITAYVFSSENWKRDPKEVTSIFSLLEDFLRKKGDFLFENGIRIEFTGRRSRFSRELLDLIENLEIKTRKNQRLRLRLAVDYGGRQEIINAAQLLAKDAVEGKIDPDHVDENLFSNVLGSGQKADPDLLIRTGGEKRLSNFLLFQNAYTELFFTKVLWPDFRPRHLKNILEQFRGRERLFGGVRP